MSIKIGNLDVSSFKVGSADCRVYLGDTCVYSGDTPTPHDYSQDYLTFRALEDGTFSFSGSGAISANTLEYSVDSGSTWSTLQNSGTTPTVTSGNTILWKASGLTIGTGGIGRFSSTSNFEVEGNIMSLLYGDNFVNQTDLTGYNYAFRYLFSGCTTITSAENLILLATTLANSCYQSMFQACTSLTTAPELPATTLVSNCYGQMFYGCTSLVTAPELLATTLADSCYQLMFRDCTSLTTAPSVLPATTLAERCYYGMFNNCTSLTAAPELPATTLANGCYQSMFESCTSLTTAPELLATTLAYYCYFHMFSSCTNLSSITCLATSISADKCTQNWLNGVSASGTFTKAASMTSWTTDVNGIPSGWTVVDYSG